MPVRKLGTYCLKDVGKNILFKELNKDKSNIIGWISNLNSSLISHAHVVYISCLVWDNYGAKLHTCCKRTRYFRIICWL